MSVITIAWSPEASLSLAGFEKASGLWLANGQQENEVLSPTTTRTSILLTSLVSVKGDPPPVKFQMRPQPGHTLWLQSCQGSSWAIPGLLTHRNCGQEIYVVSGCCVCRTIDPLLGNRQQYQWCGCACMPSPFSCVQLLVTLCIVARRAPLPMGFSRQEYWSACCTLLQGMFLTQGSNLCLLHLPHWQVGSLPLAPPGKPVMWISAPYSTGGRSNKGSHSE